MKYGVCSDMGQQGKPPCGKKDMKQELADLKQREEKGLTGKKMEGRGSRWWHRTYRGWSGTDKCTIPATKGTWPRRVVQFEGAW